MIVYGYIERAAEVKGFGGMGRVRLEGDQFLSQSNQQKLRQQGSIKLDRLCIR